MTVGKKSKPLKKNEKANRKPEAPRGGKKTTRLNRERSVACEEVKIERGQGGLKSEEKAKKGDRGEKKRHFTFFPHFLLQLPPMNDLPPGDDLLPGDDPEEKEKKRRIEAQARNKKMKMGGSLVTFQMFCPSGTPLLPSF